MATGFIALVLAGPRAELLFTESFLDWRPLVCRGLLDASLFVLFCFALSPWVTSDGSVDTRRICRFLPMSVKPGNGT